MSAQLHLRPQMKLFSRQVLPIRLIDISATIDSLNAGIHFVVPLEWNFHVISHTWSMEIRNLSEQIGQQIQLDQQCDAGQPKTSSSIYNFYFQQVDLRGKPAYHELMEFLSLLAEDGVTYAWFDALCINQTDNNEKNMEIANMGAYYSNSQGCYVIVHGIGQGYSLWGKDGTGVETTSCLPRWFDRIWTLQEFVLPSRLTFVTELSQRVQMIVKGLITKINSSVGFCRCCILQDVLRALPPGPWRSRLEFLRASGMDVEAEANYVDDSLTVHEKLFPGLMISYESEIVCGKSVCSACGTSSLITRFRRRCNPNSTPELYMVEREAYLFLLYLDTFFPLNYSYTSMPRIFELNRSLEQIWDPGRVIYEITIRECSHEEDRVLGILGLLGVGGEMQVRTGESLEQQLVHLGRYCKSADPDLLVRMCLLQGRTGLEPGMSWAPSLCEDSTSNGEVCDLSLELIVHFQHLPGDPGVSVWCCHHLTPGQDVLPQLDLSKVRACMAQVVSQLDRLSDLKRRVEVVDCSAHGIMLEARAAAGRVMPYAMLRPEDQAAVKGMMQAASASTSCGEEAQSQEAEPFGLQQWKAAGGVTESPADHTPTHCIYFQEAGVLLPLIVTLCWVRTFRTEPKFEPVLVMADAVRPWNAVYLNLAGNAGAGEALEGVSFMGGHRLEDVRLRIEMEVWVLLMGSVGKERRTSYDVSMVCLGRKGSDLVELHKVGVFVLPSTVGSGIFEGSNGASRMRYLLGGFGKDLRNFVHVSLMNREHHSSVVSL